MSEKAWKVNVVHRVSLRTADVSPRSSPLRDVWRGRTSATQGQKFHTDDAKLVRNPVRSANRPFYRYGGHIELIRFKEYYRMLRGHEHISFVFSGAFRDSFS